MATKLLALCATRREGSHNYALLKHASELAKQAGAEVELLPASAVDLPLYDDSFPAREALPAGVLALLEKLEAADGIIISSPEYNWSMPAALKNIIDWLSIVRPQPFAKKTALLLSASPSRRGGLQGLMQLRVPLDHLHAHVFPRVLAVGEIAAAWKQDGGFHDAALEKECADLVKDFVAFTAAQKTL